MNTTTTVQTIASDRNPIKFIEVRVYYNKGGINYASGNTEPRGYWLSVSPVTIEHRNGMEIRGFRFFSGIKSFIEPAARFSAKKLEQIAATVRDAPPAGLAGMLASVKEKDPDFAPVAGDPPDCGCAGAERICAGVAALCGSDAAAGTVTP